MVLLFKQSSSRLKTNIRSLIVSYYGMVFFVSFCFKITFPTIQTTRTEFSDVLLNYFGYGNWIKYSSFTHITHEMTDNSLENNVLCYNLYKFSYFFFFRYF